VNSRADTNDLEQLLESGLATRETRREDWDTLAFQTAAGPEFRRAQIRYVGSGATGDHEADTNIIGARGFTFSNMLLPPGAIGPEHTHGDAEEAFFILEGQVEVAIHRGDERAARLLGYRDMVVIPRGVSRSLKNVGDGDALLCVVIGSGRPAMPTYPKTSPVHGLSRD
jgi:quercetin dioxygenase-like cupin family protein